MGVKVGLKGKLAFVEVIFLDTSKKNNIQSGADFGILTFR